LKTAKRALESPPLERLRLLGELLAEEEGFYFLHALLQGKPQALLALEEAREALRAYVSPDLVLARLALDLEP